MNSIICPCGQDCFADMPEEARAGCEGTFHWKSHELRNAALAIAEAAISGPIQSGALRIVEGIDAMGRRMHEAQERFIRRYFRS